MSLLPALGPGHYDDALALCNQTAGHPAQVAEGDEQLSDGRGQATAAIFGYF